MASADNTPGPGGRGHVLLASDRFKGSLSATAVTRHLAAGLRRVRPDVPVVELPVPSAGDGLAEAALAAGWRRVETEVSGPAGRPVRAVLAVDRDTAVVDLGEACAPRLLPGGRPRPLTATSLGAGQLLGHALRGGARRIVLALGASAAADGGAGLVQGLGGRLLDAAGRELPPGGAALRSLQAVDLRGLPDLSRVELVLAGDVSGVLLGRSGTPAAAREAGAETDAGRDGVRTLDAGLRRWADVAEAAVRRSARDRPGAGAGGGAGFAAMALLGATPRPGSGFLLDLLGFAGRARGARLVVTGEGALDTRTLRGRTPAGVARSAARSGTPVVAVTGRRGLTGEQLRRSRIQAVYALADIERDVGRSMRHAGPLLEQLTVAIADEWLP
ncbi:Glycerate 2-kinase [Actinomadura rubteroloni]|uniref:Glycerate 2-kinase n=1 Tax=Actinomadura rubteroloni TaxID=1926885 RepID=A0A2P4UGM6_9ACTN|nr:glycerate kinase [Actinomadura rubteroloni]POM24217.1 Glycerate 2-kinase [Actinomadura rubteroloni]